ncbi:MAG: hypothetical protein O2857_23145 [Planctomycetota bacterium]|nr:hypothetical protein [Planctomycetota bacterium]
MGPLERGVMDWNNMICAAQAREKQAYAEGVAFGTTKALTEEKQRGAFIDKTRTIQKGFGLEVATRESLFARNDSEGDSGDSKPELG